MPVSPYAVNRKPRQCARVVVDLSVDLLEAVDSWGAAQGHTSRRATVERLLRMALEVADLKDA